MSMMGSIAAQDEYRPLGNDPWTNTMRGTPAAPGQGFEPVQQSPVLYNTKAGPITEADIENTIGVGMGVSGGGLKTDIVKAPGIKAFHSSPHDFDKFDLAKIGSGEGAQVYGHGLYFAENPAVSGQGGQYWQQFANRFGTAENSAAQHLAQAGFDRELAAKRLRDMIANPNEGLSPHNLKTVQNIRQEAVKLLESDKLVGPRTYEVNINADPAHMLDWDKPLIRQTPEVKKTLQDVMGKKWDEFKYAATPTAIKQGLIASSPERTAAVLNEAGIPGTRYLDERSRTAAGQISMRHKMLADPNVPPAMKAKAAEELAAWQAENQATSNYVVSNPSILDIVKKYGIAGATPAGMGALAAQDAYRGDQ